MEMTESLASAGFNYYVWWFPGSPVRVHLALDVVRRLKEQLHLAGPQAPEEGLLFGRAADGATEVFDFQSTPGRVSEAVGALAKEAGQRLLVGYYRVEAGDSLRLADSDLVLAQACFTNPYQVFLVIQPTGFGPANASFFFRDKGGKMGEFGLMEFPFDSALLANEERGRQRRSQQAAVAVQTVSVPPPVAPAPRRSGRGLLVVGLLLVVVLTFVAGLSINKKALEKWWSAVSREPHFEPAAVAAAPAPTLASVAMGLRARRENSDVEITWNRESLAIVAATSGVLSVQDGTARRDIPLDATQLRNSSIIYSPTTNQVSIQLAVTTTINTLIESMMVLLPDNGPAKPWMPAPNSSSPVRGVTEALPKPTAHREVKPFTPPPTATTARIEMLPPPVLAGPAPGANLDSLATMIVQPVMPPAVGPAKASEVKGGEPGETSLVYRPAEPVRRVVPRLPAEMLTMIPKPKTIEVRVTIDKKGQVTHAEAISQSGVNSAVLEKLITAARSWTFLPARKGVEPISSDYVLQFHFGQ